MINPKLLIGWLVVLLLLASPPASAQEHNAEAAQQRYSRGLSLFEAGQYAEALEEFRASESLFGSPNSRLFIARSLVQLGDEAGAVAAYELVIPVADDRGLTDVRYLATRRAALSELQEIEPHVARLTLIVPDAPPGLQVQVGEQQIPRNGLGVALAFAPGTVRLHVEAPGFRSDERNLTLVAGSRQEISVALQPVPAPVIVPPAPVVRAVVPEVDHRPHPPWRTPVTRVVAIASGGVALAGLVAFGVLAYVTNESYETLRAQCADGPCPESARPELDRGRMLQTLTDVSLGVGLAGLAGAAVFFTLGPRIERVVPGLHIALSPNEVAINGRF